MKHLDDRLKQYGGGALNRPNVERLFAIVDFDKMFVIDVSA
jgi:hypothetical protein